MAQPCCDVKQVCLDPASPVVNYSSEAQDLFLFFARSYGYGPFIPPIGSDWTSNENTGFGEDPDPEKADDNASNDKLDQDGDDWPITIPDPDNPGGPPITTPRPVFCNTEQHCTFTCPNGDPFTIVIPAGRFCAFDLGTANLMAYSAACTEAATRRVCLSSLSASQGCVGSSFSGIITAIAATTSVTFTITSGSIPNGLSAVAIDGKHFGIVGTPTTSGEFTFTVQANDGAGHVMSHQYTMTIREVVPSTLPAAQVNAAYSETISLNPSVAATFAVTAGTLPDGLSLNANTGEISGTPTTVGTYNFTITATF